MRVQNFSYLEQLDKVTPPTPPTGQDWLFYSNPQTTSYNGTTINTLMKVDTNGNLDTAFNTNIINNSGWSVMTGGIQGGYGMIHSDGYFYGGAQPSIGTLYIYKVDGNTGDVVASNTIQNWGQPFQLATYVAGDYVFLLYESSNSGIFYIARFNKSDLTLNQPASWTNGLNNRRDMYQQSISDDGTNIYLGGSFTSFNGTSANRLTKFDINTGVIDTAWQTNVNAIGINADVRAVTYSNGYVFVGNDSGNIYKIDATTGNLAPGWSTTGGNSIIFSVATDNNDQVMWVGTFSTFKGNSLYKGVAVTDFNGNIDTTFHTNAGTGTGVGFNGSNFYLGGKWYIGSRGGNAPFNWNGTSYSNHLLSVNPDGTINDIFGVGRTQRILSGNGANF